MDKPVNAENMSPSLIAEGVSSRPSMQRIQEGLIVAQWGADGSGKLGSNSLKMKIFDAFMWAFWLGLLAPIVACLVINHNDYPTDHEHRFSVVYQLTLRDIKLVRALFLFISTALTGHALEVLFLYSVKDVKRVKPLYKFAQLLFPFFVSIAFFCQSVMGLPYLVLGLWKCGFPENFSYIIKAAKVFKHDRVEFTALLCDGVGGLIHHTATTWCCCALASGFYVYGTRETDADGAQVIVPEYRVLALVLPPVAQHWAVIIKYRSHLLYTIIVLIIEIWFQSEYYSAFNHGNFSMKFAGTALVVSHYLYFLSAVLALRPRPATTTVDQKRQHTTNEFTSAAAEGVSSRPSMQRIQEGLIVAQWGADGSGKLGSSSLKMKIFDAFMWVFWLGLVVPLVNVVAMNRKDYPADHAHRFSVVYQLSYEDILLVRTLYLFISTALTGHALEVLFLYSVKDVKRVKALYKFVQLLFPFFVSIAFFSHSVLALPLLVLGLWKCGFPENFSYIIKAAKVFKHDRVEFTALLCDGVGGLIHHTAAAWLCCALASGYYKYDDYRVLALVLPPVAQHCAVIIKYRSQLLYTIIVLILEIWFQSEYYSAFNHGNFSMKFAGTALVVSHYLYFLSAVLALRPRPATTSIRGLDRSSGSQFEISEVYSEEGFNSSQIKSISTAC